MNTRRLLMPAFLAVALAQLAVPASMIVGFERTLRAGALYKFKTAPVDPYDAFRGRYVALAIQESSAPTTGSVSFARNEFVYAVLDVDTNGFARFSGVSLTEPAEGDYIRAKALPAGPHRVRLDLPFDRFYMKESEAPEAERLYGEHSRRGAQDAYVSIRVRSGRAAIEDLYVAGKPILEHMRKAQ
ncbi:MAG: GDYXXLXY domain-containing protein [Kiritimatiellae bacterium]|nr:GDYXXLXY domain-containing protein [Kiritimatiellia bacterium]